MSSSDAAWPRISVVTPSFNQGRFLRETMESIHSQGYPNLEHIVMDGGSTDESTSILAEYDSRLAFWVSEKDKGQTDAIARGFDRATGDIFCWLNSDDVFVPGTLAAVGTIFRERAEIDFLYGDAVWIDEVGGFIKHKKEQTFNRFVICFDHNFIPQPSTFWKANLYRVAGGVDRTFNLAMDADLWLRMAEISKPKHISQDFSMMRFYGEQKNTRLREQSLIEMQRLRDRYYPQARGIKARRLAARIARVLGKTASRGYSIDEVRSRGWEKRQLDR